MEPTALVGRVTDVQPHPDNDKLNNKMDIVTISGRTNVANRPSPDEPRYKVGDFAVMLAENTILPDWLMKSLGMWDDKKNQGMLGGKKKNRLRPRAMGIDNKITSEVALYPCKWESHPDRIVNGQRMQSGVIVLSDWSGEDWPKDVAENTPHQIISSVASDELTPEGMNVAWNLGIEEVYEEKE